MTGTAGVRAADDPAPLTSSPGASQNQLTVMARWASYDFTQGSSTTGALTVDRGCRLSPRTLKVHRLFARPLDVRGAIHPDW